MSQQKYSDSNNKVVYLFLNFPNLLTDSEKVKLILEHGKPRSLPLGKTEFEKEGLKATIDFDEVWQTQAIIYVPEAPENNIQTLEL